MKINSTPIRPGRIKLMPTLAYIEEVYAWWSATQGDRPLDTWIIRRQRWAGAKFISAIVFKKLTEKEIVQRLGASEHLGYRHFHKWVEPMDVPAYGTEPAREFLTIVSVIIHTN